MIGTTVQKYRIVQELGSGAMGAVYEAVDTLTERPVAMKVLRAELATQPELMERFRSEAVTLGRLNHPNIALLYDFFLDNANYFMAMEFVRGQPLESIIRSYGCLEATAASRIMRQTLDALEHAHSMGVLHRDIKPANILVTGDGRVKVTDFGIARVLGSSRMTRHGRIIGTLEYIAPERIRGDESDPRSDLYSAGVVLFEMLTGRLPFTAQTDFELIKAHLEQEPPVLREVLGTASPGDWDAVVHKAMAKSADQRFQTAEDFCHALPAATMAVPAGNFHFAMPLNLTRLAPSVYPEATAQPEPLLKPQPEPQAEAWESECVSEAGAVEKKKQPIAVILASAGALAVVLVFAMVLLIRSGNGRKAETSPLQPPTVTTTPDQSLSIPDATKGDGSWRSNEPGVATSAQSSRANESIPEKPKSGARKDSREERRKAALRALDGKEPDVKKSKRSDALKALDQ